MTSPPPFASRVDRLDDGSLGVRLRPATADQIRASLGDPFWGKVSEIDFEPGPEPGPGPVRIDVALHPAAHSLVRLRGLRWSDASRLCKSERPLVLEHVGFEWGPGEHVLRRLGATTALPRLRTLETRAFGFSPEVGQLLDLLRDQGRALQRLILVTGTRLGEREDLTLEVRSRDGGVETTAELRGGADEASAIEAATGFALPLPIRSFR